MCLQLSSQTHSISDRLLRSGQMEIVSGGWVMPDEAASSYYAIVDQVIEGHHWLWENFAYRPNVSWAIDPFGQSTTMAYLVRKMGFTGMVIGRVHYEVKKYLALRKALEFKWRQSWDRNTQAQIPCHMLAFYAYDVPHTCGPDPAVCCQFDFRRLKMFPCPWKIQPKEIHPGNVAERTALLIDQYRKKSTLYNQRGVLLVPLGDDFRFLSTTEWELQLNNYNQIIHYLEAHPELRVKLRFATLSEYFREFYRHRNHDYWSGYFTSRPIEKLITRVLESELRAAEILYTYARRLILSAMNEAAALGALVFQLDSRLSEARRNLGLFQHHDAVTGTAKPHVAADYNQRLLAALQNCRLISTISAAVLLLIPQQTEIEVRTNPPMNLAQVVGTLQELETASLTENAIAALRNIEDNYSPSAAPIPYRLKFEAPDYPIPIVLFNPLPHPRTTVVTIEMHGTHESFNVNISPSFVGAPQDTTIIQVESLSTESTQPVRLRVGPVHLAPLSVSQLVLIPSESSGEKSVLVSPEPPVPTKNSNLIWLSSESIRLGFDGTTGFLRFIRRQYYDKIPFQGNLYPMPCGVFIQSVPSEMNKPAAAVVVPRLNLFSTYTHGVTSPDPGSIYVWLDRRSPHDDNRGLFDALLGTWIARSNFRLFAELVSPDLLFHPGAAPVLTHAAHNILTDLVRPVQRFIADHHMSPHMARTVSLMPDFTLPSDYELVSLKTFNLKTELFKLHQFTNSLF
ncbi:unnamed protein product [Echinostoma caproni]|uniref:mannosyl-oligosaccharide 1,3-1,6-alpha-mannosidase n=1 Tax=Echinostoma caproni TaxID=27848 RepID=A0A183AHZ1_9TREM|nr:unnamed protein product [Echinostoma caproni]